MMSQTHQQVPYVMRDTHPQVPLYHSHRPCKKCFALCHLCSDFYFKRIIARRKEDYYKGMRVYY